MRSARSFSSVPGRELDDYAFFRKKMCCERLEKLLQADRDLEIESDDYFVAPAGTRSPGATALPGFRIAGCAGLCRR
jgi:hypothetical protein